MTRRRQLLRWARDNPERIVAQFLALEQAVRDLKTKLRALEDRLAQNSANSSKPPSSDGLAKKPTPQSLRKKSGRKPGGQPGHAGRTLQRVKHPDRIQRHRLEICPHCCGAAVGRQAALDYESRQVFDLPERSLEVTEHQAEIKCCPECGEQVRAEFPVGVNAPAQYGPRFTGMMVYLNQQHFIAYDRLTQLCEDLFGQPLSTGTLVAANAQAYGNLGVFERAVVRQLTQAPAVHLDESGVRVQNQLHWLHVACTASATFYGVHPKRGTAALDFFGIVGVCRRWVVHDHWRPYFAYQNCLHALCNQHLLRELRFFWEQEHAAWAKQLSDLLLEFHRRRQAHGPLNERACKRAWKRYRVVLRRGRYRHPRRGVGGAQSGAANLLDRLEDFEQNVLAFLWEEAVPFTNNQAERDIRMVKVRQKISGCFRTLRGAQVFCRIRGSISACRKRGLNIWEALSRAMIGRPFIPSAPACGH
jgi:transposase